MAFLFPPNVIDLGHSKNSITLRRADTPHPTPRRSHLLRHGEGMQKSLYSGNESEAYIAFSLYSFSVPEKVSAVSDDG